MKYVHLIVMLMFTLPIHSAVINVGSNGCSLRDAIRSANVDATRGQCSAGSGADVIITPDNWTITLNSALPTVTSDMTIRTATAGGLLQVSGDRDVPIMEVQGASTDLVLTRIRFYDGMRSSAFSGGGAALRIRDASVTVNDSQFDGNEVIDTKGGAINIKDGTLNLNRVRFEENNTDFIGVLTSTVGGAVYGEDSILNLTEVWFTENHAGAARGDALFVSGGTLNLEQSLVNELVYGVAGDGAVANVSDTTFSRLPPANYDEPLLDFRDNSSVHLNHVSLLGEAVVYDSLLWASNSILDTCFLTGTQVMLNTHNLFTNGFCLANEGTYMYLLSLNDNGGFSPTRALSWVSPAINAGDPTYCSSEDQRGEPRDGLCDVGAYEANGYADVEVLASVVGGPPFGSHQTVTANLTVRNNGPGVADAIELDVNLDAIFIQQINSGLCPQFPCQINSLAAGAQVTIPVTANLSTYLSDDFTLTLKAHSTAGSTHFDPDEYQPNQNNEISYSEAIVQAADVGISLMLNTPPPYFIGQSLSYTAEISNDGPQNANNIRFDWIDGGLTLDSFSGCSSVIGEQCLLNVMSNGQSIAVAVNATVTASQFNAAGSVSADQLDTHLGNNLDDQQNGGGVTNADVSVDMSVMQAGPYYSDQWLQFKITVSTGNQPASNVQLWSDFPGAYYFGIDFCSTIPCDIGSMAANSDVTLFFDVLAPIASPGIIDDWTHTVWVSPGQTDTNPSNNQVVISEPLNTAADVAVFVNLLTDPPYVVGQEVSYQYRVVNGGVNHATQLTADLQADNLELLWIAGNHCSSFPCQFNQLDAFQDEIIQLQYRIPSAGAFNLAGSASAQPIDPVINNNQDNVNGGVADSPANDLIFVDGFDGNL
ncbi:MAG: choice-of-anchor Q domain-containing protein [Marinicella sp.]